MSIWILILAVLLFSVGASDCLADLQDVDAGFWVGSGLLGVAMVTSIAGNTIHIARGDGSTTWGWIGIASGSVLAIATVAADNPGDAAPYFFIPAGITAGLGVWSLLLSRRDEPGDPQARRLMVAPGLSRGEGGSLRFSVAGSLRF
jgi:hypothetical protein